VSFGLPPNLIGRRTATTTPDADPDPSCSANETRIGSEMIAVAVEQMEYRAPAFLRLPRDRQAPLRVVRDHRRRPKPDYV
jgi:hypothetical protein